MYELCVLNPCYPPDETHLPAVVVPPPPATTMTTVAPVVANVNPEPPSKLPPQPPPPSPTPPPITETPLTPPPHPSSPPLPPTPSSPPPTALLPPELSNLITEIARCGTSSSLPWNPLPQHPPRKRKNGIKRTHPEDPPPYTSLREALAQALVAVLERSFRERGYKPSPAEKKRCEVIFKKRPPKGKGAISEVSFGERKEKLLRMLLGSGGCGGGGGGVVRNGVAKRKRGYVEMAAGKQVMSGVVSVPPPFTIQRMAEVLATPEKYYTQTHKLCNGLEKLLLVTSSSNAFGGSSGGEVTQRLNEEREIKLLATERGREHQLRRFKRRSSSANASTSPQTQPSQDMFLHMDDADDGAKTTTTVSTPAMAHRLSPPYDFHESSPSNDVTTVATTAVNTALKQTSTSNNMSLDTSQNSTATATSDKTDPKNSSLTNGMLSHASIDSEKDEKQAPLNGVKINGTIVASQQPHPSGELFVSSGREDSTNISPAIKTTARRIEIERALSPPPPAHPITHPIRPLTSPPAAQPPSPPLPDPKDIPLPTSDPLPPKQPNHQPASPPQSPLSLPDNSHLSNSPSSPESDYDSASSDSDSVSYNEPFTAARLMALNRMQAQQQQQRRDLGKGMEFRVPPSDAEYQSGDSIDSTMAEDSGGSDSSSSDLAD